ncbi:MAG: peptidoglycan DD-metalloendopeptidase family protein [Bacteroidetes bacterium]|nr:peptidoglycan DD-metalloendopeptidase family protein [Bacteroidota bacterium]HET6245843.1 M23 family metallopeptidase [Bacteroidia bacterium]
MLFYFKYSKFFSFVFLLLIGCFGLFNQSAFANTAGGSEDEKEVKDTVRAIVLYGNKFLIKPSAKFSEEIVFQYIDSLFNMPSRPDELIKQINLFIAVKEKSESEIYMLIDSLFELEHVPYALINQINYFVATRAGTEVDITKAVAITSFYDESEFPGNCFYDSWDTHVTHPYTDDLWREDSSPIVLVLRDTMNFCNYIHPHKGKVSSNFGRRDGKNHNGIDISLRTGEPVLSAFDGKVRIARNHGGYGNVVVVRHYNGLETLYAHLHKIKVKPGQEIAAGQLVGLGGNTGRSTGSHLHFEVRFKGKPLNPNHLINFSEKQLKHEAIVLNKTKWSYSICAEGAEYHLVEKGEYLSEIAERYGLSVIQLCEFNSLSRKSILQVGQRLRVS